MSAPLTTRKRLEAEIERLIGLLDLVDADPDLEPDLDAEAGTWQENQSSRKFGLADEHCEDGDDDQQVDDRPCDWDEIELDLAELDEPGHIWGGQGA